MQRYIIERIAIESYRELILYVGERDPTTRRLLEDILTAEEEHAEDLATLMFADTASEPNGKGPGGDDGGA